MGLVRRRPLLRAAVVGGGAYAAGKHVARKEEGTAQGIEDAQAQAQQAQQMAAQAAAPPQAAAGAGEMTEDDITKLKQLAELRDQGVLTDEEFQQEKRKILG
ncbi:MAG TPA: SHOCT domain-containing protein [Candidatus Anoxymicrobiaceae bacterium]